MKNSMTNLGLVEETTEYRIFHARFKDTIQIFRQWKDSDLIEIKFTDEFARAYGYKDKADMMQNEPEMKFNLNMYCGGVPEWVQIVNRQFCVKTNMTAN